MQVRLRNAKNTREASLAKLAVSDSGDHIANQQRLQVAKSEARK
jgi:hypothetical protein